MKHMKKKKKWQIMQQIFLKITCMATSNWPNIFLSLLIISQHARKEKRKNVGRRCKVQAILSSFLKSTCDFPLNEVLIGELQFQDILAVSCI